MDGDRRGWAARRVSQQQDFDLAFNFFKRGDSKPPDDSGNGGGGGSGDGGAPFSPQPDKARRFFEHARTTFEASNYEYSMTLWLQGLRQDPTDMYGVDAFFKASAAFLETNPKAKSPTKEQLNSFREKGPVEKYLLALLNWGTKPTDWSLGLKAMESAAELGLGEAVYWIGERVMRRAQGDAGAKKAHYVTMMNAFSKVGAFDRAVLAGDIAVRLDPTDQKLSTEVRNMSAQATIARGGYEASGQAGGFRKNIKDLAGQTQKEEEERLVKSEETMDRVVERNREDYESRPLDQAAIQKYAKSLMERGKPEDEKAAYETYMKGYETTKAYKFREAAGNIRMRVGRRKLGQLEDAVKADPGNADLAARVERMRREILEYETQEFTERVAAYPTNLEIKFRLGERLVQLERYDDAIEQLQLAQNAPGLQSTVLNMLSQCFSRMGWLDEAEGTYRKALEGHVNHQDDTGMELRYGLMDTLQRKAKENSDAAAAEEALKLASGIATQKFGYRDIRARREAIQALLKELRGK